MASTFRIPRNQAPALCQKHIELIVSRKVEIEDFNCTPASVVVPQTLQDLSVRLSQMCTSTPPFSPPWLPSPRPVLLPNHRNGSAPSLHPHPASNLSWRLLGDRMPYKQPIQKDSYENDTYRDRNRVGYDLCLGHFGAGRLLRRKAELVISVRFGIVFLWWKKLPSGMQA